MRLRTAARLAVLFALVACLPFGAHAQELLDERVVLQTTKGNIELAFYKDVAPVTCFWIQSSAQQLNELLLPLTRLDPASWAVSWELKRRACDRSAAKVRSF